MGFGCQSWTYIDEISNICLLQEEPAFTLPDWAPGHHTSSHHSDDSTSKQRSSSSSTANVDRTDDSPKPTPFDIRKAYSGSEAESAQESSRHGRGQSPSTDVSIAGVAAPKQAWKTGDANVDSPLKRKSGGSGEEGSAGSSDKSQIRSQDKSQEQSQDRSGNTAAAQVPEAGFGVKDQNDGREKGNKARVNAALIVLALLVVLLAVALLGVTVYTGVVALRRRQVSPGTCFHAIVKLHYKAHRCDHTYKSLMPPYSLLSWPITAINSNVVLQLVF